MNNLEPSKFSAAVDKRRLNQEGEKIDQRTEEPHTEGPTVMHGFEIIETYPEPERSLSIAGVVSLGMGPKDYDYDHSKELCLSHAKTSCYTSFRGFHSSRVWGSSSSSGTSSPSPDGFVDQLSRSLHVEYRHHGIDIQCQIPLYIATKMATRVASIQKSSIFVPSPEDYVEAAIRHIGYEPRCMAYWSHSVQWFLASLAPECYLDSLSLKRGLKRRALSPP
ncbi:hypothetical protein SAY86_018024 [Trapa natans]|uniref:Uncharacterized protein n=1 Tax=Trapa natans TaxID=22666 RepID=A0AAN7M772_TRANT|nr:hypothetical protein SAY86_018024 [Trapa natans]